MKILLSIIIKKTWHVRFDIKAVSNSLTVQSLWLTVSHYDLSRNNSHFSFSLSCKYYIIGEFFRILSTLNVGTIFNILCRPFDSEKISIFDSPNKCIRNVDVCNTIEMNHKHSMSLQIQMNATESMEWTTRLHKNTCKSTLFKSPNQRILANSENRGK